ncbi:MAG: glycosyltransferase family 4 protein [Bacteroidetes bacterium]|nr:glycosyltransferase family 4 protein [Bacteroidota bacterium]MBU1114862.1 glycosyltransferase family 4 protein [Bacteroidota bacterium]MBU1798023.1 glycosyltransferase family 4 protein [Bacteroidota bacterium]
MRKHTNIEHKNAKQEKEILFVTTAHKRYDTRIFSKECSYLKNKFGYNISLLVADGNGNEVTNNIRIYDIGASANKFKRYSTTLFKTFLFIRKLDISVIHIHDPELIFISYFLKKIGKIKVIYDVHEDFHLAMIDRPYLNKFLRNIIATTFMVFENYISKQFDFIITATPSINKRFKKLNRSATINNYPIINELNSSKIRKKQQQICYLGSIDLNRGIAEVVDSLTMVNGQLKLAGFFDPISVRNKLIERKGWEKVHELGIINRDEAASLFSESIAGICTFHPLSNHINSQPNKIFEYMSSGLPVIISNFPIWEKIIEKYNCGISVNPLDPKSISDGINYLLNNHEIAYNLGQNGLKAIKNELNWDKEVEKLNTIYKKLLCEII